MKGKSVLAVGVCLVCFVIGYLAYLGTALLIGSLTSRIDTCFNTEQNCTQREAEPRRK